MQFTRSLSDFRKVLSLVSIRKRALMVLGLFILSFVDLLSLAMLVPFLALGTAGDGLGHKHVNELIRPAFEMLGLELSIETVLAAFAVLILLKSAVSIAILAFSANSVTAITQKARLRLARNILLVRWSYLARAQVGTLTNLVSSEASALGEMFHSLSSLLAMAFQICVYLMLAFYISWPVALFALALGILMFSWFSAVMSFKASTARRQAQSVNQIAAGFSDILTGIRPMRGMGRVDRLVEVFTSQSKILSRSLRTKLIGGDLSAEVFEPIAALAIACWFYVVVSVWQLAFHNLLVIGLILIRVTTVLFGMYRLSFRLIADRERYATILRVIEETEAQREAYAGQKRANFRSYIKLNQACFSYGPRPILTDINLTLAKGSITAISGPSGAGKSTLIDLLLGLQQPSKGTILIDDESLFESISMQAWRAEIGYVPQEQFLFNDSVRSNVTLGDQSIPDKEVIAALRLSEAWSFVEELPKSLASVVGERGSALSGGQRQRICIARALVHRPSLLILDEATTALDPATERKVCQNIVTYSRSTQMTILVVSHQPVWLEMADQVYRLPQVPRLEVAMAAPRLAIR
jgi:ATP-binding cassette, subfamily C, bacterial